MDVRERIMRRASEKRAVFLRANEFSGHFPTHRTIADRSGLIARGLNAAGTALHSPIYRRPINFIYILATATRRSPGAGDALMAESSFKIRRPCHKCPRK